MASKSRTETDGVKIGVFHHEAQPDGLPRQLADIRAVSAFPRNVPRNLIAGNFVRVPQFETGDGLTTDVLDFDANVADNGSGEIDFQCLSFEDQRFGYQFASPIRRLHGDKAIGSQGMAPEVGGRLAVMLQVVNGYLLGSGSA